MRAYLRPMSATVLIAPGASGTVEGMRRYTNALQKRGIPALPVALPRSTAERAVTVYAAAVADAGKGPLVIGGHSFGGRVASLLAADPPPGFQPSGLLLLSYPLHRPGHPEQWETRTDHWPRISCPVLLLSGDRDPFGKVALLREAVRRLPSAELVVYPGVGHGIGPVFDEALDAVAAFVKATLG
jgi:predicted alpha/beta-hydrolase family hydrolase